MLGGGELEDDGEVRRGLLQWVKGLRDGRVLVDVVALDMSVSISLGVASGERFAVNNCADIGIMHSHFSPPGLTQAS